MPTQFQTEHTFEQRCEESRKIVSTRPGYVPIIIELYEKEKSLSKLPNCKFLVPDYVTHAELKSLLRRKLDLNQHQVIFLFILSNDGSLTLPSSISIGEAFDRWKSEDGFLYMVYSAENTLG